MKKRNLLIVMLALVMCFSSSVAMAVDYTDTIRNIQGGTLTAKGEISSSYTFNASTEHDTNYVYVFARTYANALGENGGLIPVEVASAEVESGRRATLNQTHPNFSTLVQRQYYLAQMDFVHILYSGTTSSNRGNIVRTHLRSLDY